MRNVKLPEDFGDGVTSKEALRLGMDSKRASKLLGIAQKHYKKGDIDSAYDAAFLAVSCDRSLLDAWLVLGAVCGQHGAFAEAQQCFRNVIEKDANHAGAHTALGEACIAVKDFAAATQALQKVVQLDPAGKNEASLRARMLLVSRGQWKMGLQALSAMAKMAQQKPPPQPQKK
jgi:tetratricopeptide (TPR) repeat protein